MPGARAFRTLGARVGRACQTERMAQTPGILITALVVVFVFLALCAAVVLVVVWRRRPATVPLAVACGLVVAALVVVVAAPLSLPPLVGAPLALLGVALAVVGGDPVTRRILAIATRGRVPETPDGGILIVPGRDSGREASAVGRGVTGPLPRERAVLRGGTTIGYLERLAAVMSIVAGFPEGLAVVVALKGIGRFSELADADARERFIIGSLASLIWACVVGALIRLAITATIA